MPAKIIQRNRKPMKKVKVDTVTIDIIESALRNARFEMDTVLFRTAMSPGIREQHDEFPMIANLEGKMVVGQFGSFIYGFMQGYDGTVEEGDVFLTNDPYSCQRRDQPPERLADADAGLQGRAHDRLVGDVRPHDRRRRQGAGIAADRCAHDLRGRRLRCRRSRSSRAASCRTTCCKVILHNCRLPTWNYSDFNAIVAALRTAAMRCVEIAQRFGDDVFYSAMDAMLERNKRAMRELIRRTVPETKQYFEDYICDDGLGHGPVQDRLLDVARRRQVHLRLHRHRPAVDLLDQLPAERGDVQDVRGRLHDHGVRPADPVQRRVLRPDGSAHPAGHAAEAAEARRAVLPHARARPHLRHARRPARPGQPGLHVRRRILRQPAFHVLGLRQERRVVPALPDQASAASRASRSATGRTGIRCGRRSPTCRTSSSRAIFRCASTPTRRSPTPAAPGRIPRRQRPAHRLPLPRAGRDLDPRRSLAHLSVGRQRRTARRAQPQDADARRRQRASCCRRRSTASRSRPATCCSPIPGAAAAAAIRSSAKSSESSSTCRRGS